MRLFVTLLLIFFVPNIFSSEPTNEEILNDLKKICSQQLCWKDGSISVQLSDKKKLEVPIDIPLPIVQGSLIYLYPDRDLFLEVDIEGDKLVNFKAVSSNNNVDKTITLKLEQRKDLSMELLIHNPFPQKLDYKLQYMPATDSLFYDTSHLPVHPHGYVKESWPFPIFQLVFFNFKILKESCSAMVKNKASKLNIVILPTLSVLELSDTNKSLDFGALDNSNISAVLCKRDSIIFKPNDYRVLEAGFPLYLRQPKSKTAKMVILERANGKYSMRVLQGKLSGDEIQSINRRIKDFNQGL